MHPPRQRLLLPVLNVIIAVVLFYLAHVQIKAVGRLYDSPYAPTATMALDGINAPTRIPVVIVRTLLELVPMAWIDHPSFTNYLDKFSYLCCIFALWYFVGREFDLSRESQLAGRPRKHGMPWNVGLLCLGIYLAAVSVLNFAHVQDLTRWNNLAGNVIEGILVWSWSLILLIISGHRIVNGVRARGTENG